MTKNSTLTATPPPIWQVVAATCVSAGVISVILGASGFGSDQVFLDEGQKFGFALGGGLMATAIVWSIPYFLLIRHSSRKAKWTSFLALATLGTTLAYLQL